ncbi:DUF2247 family protein [Gorillibacterium sp. CAU 1737]|uniref:DUF2247 family protein n=1 Tax=Gorillibacterium sp. CAU 1737 TaxID=3140362 RepID=UPI00326090C2
MYSFQIFDEACVKYNWATVLVGLKLNCYPVEEVDDYAVRYMTEHPDTDNNFIQELVWENRNYEEVITLIENLLIDLKCNINFLLEERKWRYCILHAIRKDTEDGNVLLEKVAQVYSDFNYPEVMEDLIYYNEPKDGFNPLLHTTDENINRLIKKIDDFLALEKIRISS